MNPDDLKKLLDEYTKKYTSEWDEGKYYADIWDKQKLYDPDYELMIKKKESWDYSPTLDYPDMYTPTYEPEPMCTYTEEERAECHAKWTGALVKFATHIGGNAGHPLQVSAGGTVADIIDLNMTGTVFEISLNFKERWMAQVLWANGSTTGEVVDDLVIVQAPPGT